MSMVAEIFLISSYRVLVKIECKSSFESSRLESKRQSTGTRKTINRDGCEVSNHAALNRAARFNPAIEDENDFASGSLISSVASPMSTSRSAIRSAT
jgi:hypothetical protein